MQLPLTATVTKTVQQDGSILVTSSLVDAGSAAVGTASQVFPANSRALALLDWVRESNHAMIGQQLSAADLPASFTVQIGLDTTMRELDLL